MQNGTRFLFALATLAALAAPLPAGTVAYPYVTVLSSIFSGGVDNNYDSVTGLSQHPGSCYLQGGGTGPCAALSSTPSTNVLGLTAASVAITNGVAFDPNNGISGYGDASASADLSTGILRTYVNGPNCSTPNASGCDSGGNATAQFQDGLTFNNTTGHTVNIAVDFSFDGTITPLGTSPQQSMTVLFCLTQGTGCDGNPNAAPHGPIDGGQLFYFSYQDGSILNNEQPTSGEWVSSQIIPGANSASETFSGVYAIPAGISTDSLNAYITLGCLISTCDFSHTAALSLGTLPSGVTFTSNSGVLLSDTTPEPSTWVLSLCAVGLVALRRWRT